MAEVANVILPSSYIFFSLWFFVFRIMISAVNASPALSRLLVKLSVAKSEIAKSVEKASSNIFDVYLGISYILHENISLFNQFVNTRNEIDRKFN